MKESLSEAKIKLKCMGTAHLLVSHHLLIE